MMTPLCFLRLATLSALLTPALLAGPLEVNLLANPGAEFVPINPGGNIIPGWTTDGVLTVVTYTVGGGFPTVDDPGPEQRGSRFFAGGESNAHSAASQIIDVSTESLAIDAGTVLCHLAGYLGGFLGQDDNATLTAWFANDTSTNLGSLKIGPVLAADRTNLTGLLLRESTAFVPSLTRSIVVSLDMTRASGSYNDGYADALSLVLSGGQAQPILSIQRAAGGLEVSWPGGVAGYRLRTTPSLAEPVSWADWPGEVTTRDGRFVVPATVGDAVRFFRLEK